MPELPEVETIKNYLNKFILNKKIKEIKILNKKAFKGKTNLIINKKIVKINRKGKLLIINLNKDYDMIIHLKMSGQLIYFDFEKFNDFKHLRVIFKLDRGYLIFNDLRNFGWIKLIKKEKLSNELNRIGRDALEINFYEFKKICLNSKKRIKFLLMDQNLISGIGNIYANEILFKAKINPNKIASILNNKQIKRLYLAIRNILEKAIEYEGSSSRLYLKPDGKKGNYQNHFLVYNQENKKCKSCKTTKIKRMKLNNRSTFYCPNCQK